MAEVINRQDAMAAICMRCADRSSFSTPTQIEGSQRWWHFFAGSKTDKYPCEAAALLGIPAISEAAPERSQAEYEAKLLGFGDADRIRLCRPCIERAIGDDLVIFSSGIPCFATTPPDAEARAREALVKLLAYIDAARSSTYAPWREFELREMAEIIAAALSTPRPVDEVELDAIEKRVSSRPDDSTAMQSACGEYNCTCHYEIGRLLEMLGRKVTNA